MMTGPGKPEVETRALTVRWPADQFEKIEKAAKTLSEQTGLTATPTDIIRRGALAQAELVLGVA